jgi:hypothetical protein
MAIERWLDETGIVSTKVWVGEHSYTLERPRRVRPKLRARRKPRTQIAGNGSQDDLPALEGSQMNTSSSGARFIRRVNDSVYDVFVKLGTEDGEFWCECDDPNCEERVTLTLREYAVLGERNDEPLISRSHARANVPR